MTWACSLSRGLAVTAAGLLSVSLLAALTSAPPAKPAGEPQQPLAARAPAPVPLFARTEPAANPTQLVLLPDDSGLRGWIAGSQSFAGAKVTVRAGGKDHEFTVGNDNTFAWAHKSPKPLPVVATVAGANGKKGLTARATLPASQEGVRTSAFVVTDRSAYRPGHTLKFVAYLHTTPDGLDFKPLADQEFTVDLTSETRRTRATRLKLRSDADGRVTGQYTFTDADSLDHYALTVRKVGDPDNAPPMNGSARVLLGEYRKTKVGLKLKGEVKDGKLVVTFDARDYLDREVKGSSATWSAVVTKAAEVPKLALDPNQFIAHEGGPPSVDDFDALPADERLLTLANGVSATSFAGFGARTVATREGKAAFDGTKPATAEIDLWPEWTRGQHSVQITATFLDETGRENFAVGTFSLAPKNAKMVDVSVPKELFTTGEAVTATLAPNGIEAKDKASTTLLVVKLDANPSSPWFGGQAVDADGDLLDNTRIPGLGAKAAKPAAGWNAQPVFDPVKRRIVSAVPVSGGTAEVKLNQPGAYKLLALTALADGTTLQSETGFVVKAPAKLPGVVLHLDARELNAGARLTGTAHTRFAGAKLLLTLRDSAGVRLVKPLTAGPNGLVRFDEPLPAGLRYGCAVCVQYPQSAATVHADQRDVFVVPTDRTLTVTTTAPDTVGPGAEVKLGLSVNREEEVDLVVSVFDESLLGVSGDLSADIRNRFLADVRGQGRAARDLTATRLGDVALADLVAKARKLLEDPEALAREPGLERRLRSLAESGEDKAFRLNLDDVVTLVRLTGFEVYLAHPSFNHSYVWRVPKSARLADVLRRDAREQDDRFSLSATVIDGVVLIGAAPRGGVDPWFGHRGSTGFQGFGGTCGFSCNGFGQFNGLQGVGFAGIGGMGGWGQLGHLNGNFGNFGNGRGVGFGGGIGGFGGGIGGVPSVAGFQGSFSHPGGNALFSPFVGGQMGMSFGSNRDFGPAGGPAAGGGVLPGLGVGDEMVRRDFADSAYWSGVLRTDKSGKATATFKVPDSLTNWRVQVVAVSPKMHVGSTTSRFKTSRPVMIWPMLPRAFTAGDTVTVFGTVHNLSDAEQLVRVHLTAQNGSVLSQGEQSVKVPAKGNVPVYWTYKAGKAGMTDLLMSAKCDAGSDASLKKLPVTPSAVVERATASGLVGPDKFTVTMPADFDPKDAQVTVTVAPTLAADLADTLPYLVEYPYGCVEQTMSRFLPALRVAAIVRQSGISTVKQLEEKLPKVVDAGQKRLIELQQPDGGWGWQGSGSTHEMMTPYALFGLLAAEEAGYPCPNPNTIPAGLGRLRDYLDQMGREVDNALRAEPKGDRRLTVVNDAMFCLWVASLNKDQAAKAGIHWGDEDMTRWFGRITKCADKGLLSDTGLAFGLEVALKNDKKVLADALAKALRARAQKAGDRVFWTKGGYTRWADNTIEVTAVVMKALVAHDPKDPLIPGVLAYFHSTKRGDRWDSTKDTACVLYALCDYMAAVRGGPAAVGQVAVALNGTESGTVRLDGADSKAVTFVGKDLKAGENVFAVTGPATAAGALVRVQVKFTRGDGRLTPARDHGVSVTRTVFARGADGKWAELKSGASVPVGTYLKVKVAATTPANDLRFFLIESPKPAGCETIAAADRRFPTDPNATGHVLREDREAMTCFHYEQVGAATAEFVALTEFAGTFTLPPARGELMYQPTSGGHSDAFVLTVTPKK